MRRLALAFALLVTLAACGGSDRAGSSSAGDAAAPGGAAVSAAGGKTRDTATLPLDRSQIRVGAMTVRVADVREAARTAVRTAEGTGGFLEAEKTGTDATTLTLRVPPEDFTKTADALAGLGTVTERTVSTDDVTDELADVEGRLKAARASVDRVRALLARAQTISEITSLEEEVNDREAALESLLSRLRALEGQTAYASLTVTFTPPLLAAARPDADDASFGDGLAAGWRVFRATVSVLLVVLGAVAPFAALALVVAVPVYLVRRRITAQA